MGEGAKPLIAGAVQSTWLEWGGVLGVAGGAFVLLACVLATVALSWHWSGPEKRATRVVLVALRAAAVALLVFLLLQPVIVRTVADKTTSVVAVLYDDSASMNVRNEAGESRADRLLAALDREDRAFDRALENLYHPAAYRFGTRIQSLQARDHLGFEDNLSDITGALRDTVADSRGVTLAGIVLFSDGAAVRPEGAAANGPYEDIDVPVYTVGVGEAGWRDVAVHDVSISRGFLDDAPAVVGAQIDVTGYAGESVVVEVLEGGQVRQKEERKLTGDEASLQFRIETRVKEQDWQNIEVRARIAGQENTETEYVARNNARNLLYDNREKAYQVLYFGGRPNWQHKFMLRALERDPDIQLSSLVRVSGAEKKFVFRGRDSSLGNPLYEGFENARDLPRYDEAVFLRLGLGPDELVEGYPTTPEALYPFHLIIWGAAEPDFFAPSQLTLTRDAVMDRGASFLLMGDRGSTVDDLADTVMAPLIPTMPKSATAASGHVAAHVEPTPEAFLSGVWALHRDATIHREAWNALPELPDVDLPGPARIGATVLAKSNLAGGADGHEAAPFLAWQTYGRGKGALLATGETWPWHLMTEADNEAHGRLWRQLVRALVRDVPEPTRMSRKDGEAVVGSSMTVEMKVRRADFTPVSGSLRATVTDPVGATETLPALELLERPGTYEVEISPQASGVHRVRLEGSDGEGTPVAETVSAFLAEPDRREWRDPRFNPEALREIASATGGAYFPLEELAQLPAALIEKDAHEWRRERYPLWHAWPFYVLVLLLVISEWVIRRRAGEP